MSTSPELNTGLVLAGHGRHYLVEAQDGKHIRCSPRGKKSDCVVGDRVHWRSTDTRGEEGVIEAILPRKNLFYRQDEWRTKSFAANLDHVLVMVAAEPVFSESQLSRALIAAGQARLPVTILLNKIDLPEAAALARERLAPYKAMGYDVIETSLKGADIAPLEAKLAQGATLVLGPSGTGKSTLVNRLLPQAEAIVGEISTALNSGRHTTTHTRWYWLNRDQGSALLDSPGFQEFGLQHIPLADLAAWMPDLQRHAEHCRFSNCSHDHEPGCSVLAALERGEISPSRHRIYLELRQELQRTVW
jgi:ribosome biogenesis GTPase